MRRVAERVGIRAPSIYDHLPDEQALEAAVFADGLRELAEASEAAAASPGDPLAAPTETYRGFARARAARAFAPRDGDAGAHRSLPARRRHRRRVAHGLAGLSRPAGG